MKQQHGRSEIETDSESEAEDQAGLNYFQEVYENNIAWSKAGSDYMAGSRSAFLKN